MRIGVNLSLVQMAVRQMLGGSAPWTPASLFAASEQGAWYDPSDLSTLYQDSAGTTPVTAVEQPVGLMLDKRLGLVLGSNIVTDSLPLTLSASGAVGTITTPTAGRWYELSYTVSARSGAGSMYVSTILNPWSYTTFGHTVGSYKYILYAEDAATRIMYFDAGAGGSITFSSLSVRELPGNHAFQTTSTKRPVLSARVNLLTNTETLSTQSVTTQATTYTLRFTGTGTITLTGTKTGVYTAGTHTLTGVTAGTLTVTVAGLATTADLRPANAGANLPAYQRVNTATDYDTVGFPKGDQFDGIDDSIISAAGGGSTTAFFWCASVQVKKIGAAQTLFSDTGTNTGYRVRINASNQLELSAGNGSAYTTVVTTDTLSIGRFAVLTAWHDGTNLKVQIDNGTIASQAFSTATAGTAQTTIGKDNNVDTNFFNGWICESVYLKNVSPSDADRAKTKTYVGAVAKLTI